MACVVSAAAWPAGAEPASPLVVVVTSRPDAPFVRRLAAELTLFGYRVEVQSRTASDPDLLELLMRSGGAALISVDQGSQTAEVVVGETAARPSRREREQLDPRRRADTNAAVLAERFRARLTELGIAPNAPSEMGVRPSPAPAAVATSRPAPAPRLWIAAGIGAASGGLGLQPQLELELRAFPASFVSTSAWGALALGAARVQASEGTADVRLVSGGVLIDLHVWQRRDFALRAGVGGLLVSASMSGSADERTFSGRKDAVLVPAGLFESGAAFRLTPRVSAELRAYAGACVQRIGVRFAGRTAADYGQPFLGASLGVAVGVF